MNQLAKIQWQCLVIDDIVQGVYARFNVAIVTHRSELSRHVLLWTMVSFLSAADESLPLSPLPPPFPRLRSSLSAATAENPRFSLPLPTLLRINHWTPKESRLRSRFDAKNCSFSLSLSLCLSLSLSLSLLSSFFSLRCARTFIFFLLVLEIVFSSVGWERKIRC